jgi:hypothetical protein
LLFTFVLGGQILHPNQKLIIIENSPHSSGNYTGTEYNLLLLFMLWIQYLDEFVNSFSENQTDLGLIRINIVLIRHLRYSGEK